MITICAFRRKLKAWMQTLQGFSSCQKEVHTNCLYTLQICSLGCKIGCWLLWKTRMLSMPAI